MAKAIWDKGYKINLSSDGLYYFTSKLGIKKSPIGFKSYKRVGNRFYVEVNGQWQSLSMDGKQLQEKLETQTINGVELYKDGDYWNSFDGELRGVKELTAVKYGQQRGVSAKNERGDEITLWNTGEKVVDKAPAKIEHYTEDNKNFVMVDYEKFEYDTKFDLAYGYKMYYKKGDGYKVVSEKGDIVKMYDTMSRCKPEDVKISQDGRSILYNNYDELVCIPINRIEEKASNGFVANYMANELGVIKQKISYEYGYADGRKMPSDYVNGNFIVQNPDGSTSCINNDGQVIKENITSYEQCGDGMVFEQKNEYGKDVKIFSINGVEMEVDNVKDLGYGYYAVKQDNGCFVVDKNCKNIDVYDHEFEHIEYANCHNGILNLIGTCKVGEEKTVQEIISIYQDEEEKVHTTISDRFEEIFTVGNGDSCGFICKGRIDYFGELRHPDKQYEWLSMEIDKRGNIEMHTSDNYAYMTECYDNGAEICVQMEENGAYHKAELQDDKIVDTQIMENASIKVGYFTNTYRDTMGRITDNEKQSSKQFAKYHNGEIELQDLDDRCFVDPMFTGAVLQTEKQRIKQLIEQAQTEQEVADLLKQAEQIKQQVFAKEQSLLENQKQQAKLNQAKSEAMDSLDNIL